MDLDLYVNPFSDINIEKGDISIGSTLRIGTDLKKIPLRKTNISIGVYQDIPLDDKSIKSTGINIHYKF